MPILQPPSSRYLYIWQRVHDLFLNDDARGDAAKAGNAQKIRTAAQLMVACMQNFCSSGGEQTTLMDQKADDALSLLALESTSTHGDSASVGWDWCMV